VSFAGPCERGEKYFADLLVEFDPAAQRAKAPALFKAARGAQPACPA
jgi:hypothetical protein